MKILKAIKNNIIPFLFMGVMVGLLLFPVWSHFSQGKNILVINGKISDIENTMDLSRNDFLVGASTLFAQNASVQLNLAFFGEIKPDGANCSNGDILKKTGTNDWDCATDATGTASNSNVADGLDIANSGGTFFAIASLQFDAGHFTFSNTASDGYVRLDWGAGGPASLSEAETISGNWVNTANPWADNEVADVLTINGGTVTWTDLTTYPTGCTNQFVTTVGDTLTCATADDAYVNNAITIDGGTLNSLSIGSGVTWTTTGQLTVGDNGDRVDFNTSGWDIANSVMTGMTISTNNATGTWTTTGNLTIGDGGDNIIINSDTWDVSNLGAFTGLTGIVSTGLIDFGGADLEVPNGTGGTTVNSAGEVTVDTASQSFNYYGSAERPLGPFDKCFGFSLDGTDLSANSLFAVWTADEPYTFGSIMMKASGSNSATWSLLTGATIPTTTVLTKQASGSLQKKYTTFSSSTIPDGHTVYAQVSSKSAVLDDVLIRACLYKDP